MNDNYVRGLLALLLTGITTLSWGQCFTKPDSVFAGTDPDKLIKGDFNQDGRLDFAVVNPNKNTVSVVMAKVGGGFNKYRDIYQVGSFPQSISIGEFNGDNKPDLVVANGGSGTISVLLNGPVGKFSAAITTTVGSFSNSPSAVAVGDFNGDLKSDVAVTLYSTNTVVVLLGKTQGTFQAPVSYQVGKAPVSVVVGFFNDDNYRDIAVANQKSNTITVIMGKGNGGFGSGPLGLAVTYGSGGVSPQVIEKGDFNDDGKTDLAVLNFTSKELTILANYGGGNFSYWGSYPVGQQPSALAVGDLDGDFKPDLAVANYGSATVTLFKGLGNWQFVQTASLTLPYNKRPTSISIGNFDTDGKLDLGVTGYSGTSIFVFRHCTSIVARQVFGSEELGQTLQAEVYPNPTDGPMTVSIRGASGETVRLWLVDMSGHTIMDQQINIDEATHSEPINMGPQSPGMYLIHVSTATQTQMVKVLRH